MKYMFTLIEKSDFLQNFYAIKMGPYSNSNYLGTYMAYCKLTMKENFYKSPSLTQFA